MNSAATVHSLPQAGHRRREVEERLRGVHLLLGRRLRTASERADDRDSFFVRLSAACSDLGPTFTLFARYLGSRIDHFEAVDAFTLLATTASTPLVGTDEIRGQLSRDLPQRVTLLELGEPHRDGLFQSHSLRLAREGQSGNYRVRVLPDRSRAEIVLDRTLVPLLESVFTRRGWLSGSEFTKILRDFNHELDQRLDLAAQAEAMAVLPGDEASATWIGPILELDLSFSSGLIFRAQDVRPLPGSPSGGEFSTVQPHAQKIAGLWLRLCLNGAAYPLEARYGVAADGRPVLIDGFFVRLPRSVQANFWSYLRAVSAHDPDHAFHCLERESEAPGSTRARFLLRQRIRQGVPFRDGAWTSEAECLSENIVLHWRFLRQEGYGAAPHLETFYRAIFLFAAGFERHFERPDLLRQALEDLEWAAGWAQFRQLAEPTQLGESMNAGLSTLMALPQRLDHLLDLLSRDAGPPIRTTVTYEERQAENRTVAVIALLLTLVGGLLLTSHSGVEAWFGELAESVRAGLFITLAGSLLWLIMKRP